MANEQKGTIWSNNDFDQLGWSMSRLYGMNLPGRQHQMVFHLDYILESPLSNSTGVGWTVAPAKLEFYNVADLRIELNQSNYSETSFVSIERINERLTPNGKFDYWDFKIELSPNGKIEFTSTGFRQTLLADPIKTEFQDLDREMTQ